MNKCYYRIVWENYPSDKSPVNAQNLNRIDVATDEMDNRIISLDSTKFDKSEAQLLVKYIEYDEDTGIFKITHYNGASYTIDTLLEKLAINFDYDYQTQKLIIELSDGTVKYVDLSALITQYEFLDSDTVSFGLENDGKVTAIVKEGSIQEKHLRSNYLADIKAEVAKAQASYTAAKTSETNAKASETNAKASETSAASSASTAASKATAAANSATSAATSASTATNKANDASTAATNANNSATAATNSATSAANSASMAISKADSATESANSASESAESAETYAKQSQSYAIGTGGARPNEATDSAKYYYNQAKSISESFAGALRPMGTVTFANLPSLSNATEGDMYNISDQFTTTSDFKEGVGHEIAVGANVYKTVDGKWDILAGTPVVSVNGETGNVILTPEGIGASTFRGIIEVIEDGIVRDSLAQYGITKDDTVFEVFNKLPQFSFTMINSNAQGNNYAYSLPNANSKGCTLFFKYYNHRGWLEFHSYDDPGNVYHAKVLDGRISGWVCDNILSGATMNNDATLIFPYSGDARKLEVTSKEIVFHLPSGGFAGGMGYFNNGQRVAEIGYANVGGGYYYIGEAYDNPNGKLKINSLEAKGAITAPAFNGNATSATNADTVDGKHASNFLPVDGRVDYDSIWIELTDDCDPNKHNGYQIQSSSADNVHRWYLDGQYLEYYGGYNFAPYPSIDLGGAYAKWKNIYAANGVIQTSDRTQKTNITELSDDLAKAFILGLLPSTYGMKDGTSGRTHWGLISQDIEELMDKLGMDSKDFAGFIKSPKTIIRDTDENGNALEKPVKEVVEGEYDYSLRYDEFIAPLIKMVQMQQEEIKSLQEETTKLKAELLKIINRF